MCAGLSWMCEVEGADDLRSRLKIARSSVSVCEANLVILFVYIDEVVRCSIADNTALGVHSEKLYTGVGV